MFKSLALQWQMVGSCTHTFHCFPVFLRVVEWENRRLSQKNRTIGLSDREQSHDQNKSQVIFEHVQKFEAAIEVAAVSCKIFFLSVHAEEAAGIIQSATRLLQLVLLINISLPILKRR